MIFPRTIVRRLWRRLRRGWGRWADRLPPTGRGLLLTTVCVLALWFYGFSKLDRVLLVMGIAGLVTMALAVLLVTIATWWLGRRLPAAQGGQPTRLEAGSPLTTGFSLPTLAAWPMIEVDWHWLAPAGVEVRCRRRGRLLREEVVAHRRGRVAGVRRRLEVYDVFGLCRLAREVVSDQPLTVLPNVGRLRRLDTIQSMATGEGLPHPAGEPEGDRMEFRRYAPGDPLRFVLWKTYARTRQLHVRTPERSVARSRRTVAYLAAGEGDEAAAAAARVALESGVLGEGWLFGADGTSEVIDSLQPALEAIARSASRIGEGGAGLASFLEQTAARGEIHCIVFAAARRGAWTEAALAAVRARPGRLSFVLGTDGVIQQRPVALWQRLLWTAAPRHGSSVQEITEVLRPLSAAACPAVVVDRVTGRAFGEDRRRALGVLA